MEHTLGRLPVRVASLLLVSVIGVGYIGWLGPIDEVSAQAQVCATPCSGVPGNFHITPSGNRVFAGPGGADVLNPSGFHAQSGGPGTAGSVNGGPGFIVGPPSIGGPGATHGQGGGPGATADTCDLAVSLGTDLSDCLQ